MATASEVLRIAAGEIGYSRWTDPQPGTKYGRWYAQSHGSYYGASGVPFCAMFVSWVMSRAGQAFPGLPAAYVPYVLSAGRSRAVSTRSAKPGDIVIFNWDGGVVDHIGFVEANHGSYIQTIEGNTSGSAAGKQSNGNGVWRRTRDYSVVAGVVSPYWDGPSSAAPVHASLAVDGWWGPATVRALQAALGTDQDGVVSNQDSRDMSAIGGVPSTAWQVGRGGSDVIAALQSKVGVEADRYFGPNTCRALQRYLGTEQDGVLSRPSACVREMQRRLNAGTF